ncbi:hypothetical protein R3P38DRAFT_3378417 [Favolaschia claudopus]|uniref:Uncharacterized protein n=1 Tax=Favolaschia claudopus TaxID=2862362 RepID=A0AAV9Z8M9_9AGAR
MASTRDLSENLGFHLHLKTRLYIHRISFCFPAQSYAYVGLGPDPFGPAVLSSAPRVAGPLSCSSPSYRSDIDGMLYVVASTTCLSELLAVSSCRIVRVSGPGSLGSAGGFAGSGGIL